MPSKVLVTKSESKPKAKKKSTVTVVEARKKKPRDPWLTRDGAAESRDRGRNWLTKEKSRDWLKGR